MKLRLFRGAFLLFLTAVVLFLTAVAPAALQQEPPYGHLEVDPKLPNGKSQRDEVLKVEREDNIRDAAKLVALSQSLQADLG